MPSVVGPSRRTDSRPGARRHGEVEPDHLGASQEDDRIPAGGPLGRVSVPGEQPLAGAVHVDDVHVPGGGVTRGHVVPLAPREEDPPPVRREPREELHLRRVREPPHGPGPKVQEVELVVAGPVRGPHHQPADLARERVDRAALALGSDRPAGPCGARGAGTRRPGAAPAGWPPWPASAAGADSLAAGPARHRRVRRWRGRRRSADDASSRQYRTGAKRHSAVAPAARRGTSCGARRRGKAGGAGNRGGAALSGPGGDSVGRACLHRRRRRAASPPTVRGTPPPFAPRPRADTPRPR